MTSVDLLRKVAWDGILKRYGDKPSKAVKERFEFELKAIISGGFTDYLLILWDLYTFMDEVGIPYGPGRGSAAASIVVYALGITNVCPLKYGLLFQRFINPERVSAPDIDLDISAERRGEVIAYLKERWGSDRVAQIVTFGTLGAPAAIRDMARTLGKPLALADKLAKLVPKNGSLTTDREDRHYVDETLATVKDFKALYDSDTDAKAIIDAARDVEGIIKNASVHAAGIVIADRPIVEYAPLITTSPKKDDESKERPLSVAFAMNELEHLGLIKFDLLGLQSLDIIKHCVDWIKHDKVVPKGFSIDDIPLDDPKTYSLLGLGLTAGVFQFESAGMAGWLRKLKPDHINDLIAMVALYRPGPMAFIETYVERKHGRERVEYPDAALKPALSPTYGIAVFQEQLMQIGVVVAGWSLSRADQLRKVIGKKIIDKIEQEGKEFAADAAKNGYDKAWAQQLFDEFIAPAGRYSFNKGHATVYGLLAYQTAYLKANFPLHYFAALLANVAASTKADKAEKTASYIADARAMGIAILPPDIHESGLNFTPVFERTAIRFGLLAIKNVGLKAIQVMLKEKEKNGPYTSLFDFVARSRNRLITTRTIESLVLAGALDSIPGDRHEKLASVKAACDRADMLEEDRSRVAAGGRPVNRKRPIPSPVLVPASEEILSTNLLSAERELVGTYLSGHPFNDVADKAAVVSSVDLQGLRELGPGEMATICGIVSNVNKIKTKKKLTMYTITIEDDKVSQEVIVFPQKASQYGELEVYLDQPLVLTGRLEDDEDDENANPKFILDKLYSLQTAPIRRRSVRTSSTADDDGDGQVSQRTVNRVHVTYDNYATMIGKSKAPITIVLPDGQEYICANN